MVSVPADIAVALWRHVSGTTWRRVGRIATWQTLSVDTRWLQAGPWSMTLPYNAQSAKIDTGCLLTVDFRGQRSTLAIEQPVRSTDADTGQPSLSLSGTDAVSILNDALCFPDPTQAVTQQTAADHYVATGPTETILRNLIVANADQLSWPVTVPASQDRGIQASLNERMSNLLTVVTTKCSVANLGVQVGLVSANPSSTTADLTCQFITPRDRSQRVKLVQQTGTLRSWSQSDTIPTATRAIVAGSGQGTARVFRLVVDADAEAQWQRKRTIFVDARDTSDPAVLDERGLEALSQAAAQSSFDLAATEASGMLYGYKFAVGDQVSIQVYLGIQRVDRLSSAVLTASRDEGVDVQLIPGNPDGGNPWFRQAAFQRSQRDQLRALQQED